jgi:hypothetical protein
VTKDSPGHFPNAWGYPVELSLMLSQAGSRWTVGKIESGYRLEERVDPTVQASYEQTRSSSGRAGLHLEKAWHATYGRNPNYTDAYNEAVKAVEVLAIRTFLPDDKLGTLGKVIKHLDDGKAKYAVPLSAQGKGMDYTISLFKLVWQAQDRHGTADVTAPLTATKEQAVMALHACLTLVHWLSSGLITRLEK